MIPFIQSTFSTKRKKAVWVSLGQSNMRPNTGVGGNSNTDTYPEGTLQWGRYLGNNNTLIPATVPLDHWDNDDTPLFGPGLMTSFANQMKVAYPNEDIIFIPCAKGSSSFQGGDWNQGDLYYNDMVARVNLCMSENPDFIFKGLLWHQGESDREASANYTAAITAFNSAWRSDINAASAESVFICGGLLSSWMDANPGGRIVNDSLIAFAAATPYAAFASSEVPTILTGHDSVHFTSDGSLTLGERFALGYPIALNNN